MANTGSLNSEYLAHPQRRAECPHQPPLLLQTVPLPALVDVLISLCRPTTHPSLRPQTAVHLVHLLPTAKVQATYQDWRQQPATNPSAVRSMAIIVPGLERVVVVFPATLDSDVLVAVYHAVQEWAFEHHREFGTKRYHGGEKGSGQADSVTVNAYAKFWSFQGFS